MTFHELQTVYTLYCGCRMSADEYRLIESLLDSDNDDNLTVSFNPNFLINLPYLSHFFDETLLRWFEEDEYFNESIPAVLPTLSIASAKYKANIAADEDLKIDLEHIINATKQNATVYGKLSHYLYKMMLNAHQEDKVFDIFNFLDWLLLLATISGGVALVLVLILHFKVKTMFMMLSTVRSAKAIETLKATKLAIFLFEYANTPKTMIANNQILIKEVLFYHKLTQ